MLYSTTQYEFNDFLPSDHIYVIHRNVADILGNRATDSSDSLLINDGTRRFLQNSSNTKNVPADWPGSTSPTRSHEILFLAINHHYPEIEGGFYQNAELIARIQLVLSSLHYHFTETKYYRMEGFVPHVFPGSLRDDTDYVLLDNRYRCITNTIQGFSRLWQDMGSNDPFFHNRRVLAIMTDSFYFFSEAIEALRRAIPPEYITFKTTQP